MILLSLLILFNIFIVFTTKKANLPSKLFVKADNYKRPVILWELFFGFWLFINILVLINWVWIGFYIESLITLFFTYILLSLRAGQVSKYNKIE